MASESLWCWWELSMADTGVGLHLFYSASSLPGSTSAGDQALPVSTARPPSALSAATHITQIRLKEKAGPRRRNFPDLTQKLPHGLVHTVTLPGLAYNVNITSSSYLTVNPWAGVFKMLLCHKKFTWQGRPATPIKLRYWFCWRKSTWNGKFFSHVPFSICWVIWWESEDLVCPWLWDLRKSLNSSVLVLPSEN